MQRAGVKEHLRAGQQRRKQPDRQTKRVEQRQRRHKAVMGGKIGDGFDLLNVRQNAFVTVHHPFRVAFRTGGKQNDRRVLRLLRHLRQTRHQHARKDPQLIGGGDIAF